MTTNFNGYTAREYFCGTTFTKENPTRTWSFAEEDDDEDFLSHTLYLKQATLGKDAPQNENHILQVETQDYEGNDIKSCIVNLNSSRTAMTNLDLSFDHKTPVTFRLIDGEGPIDLAATHLVEFPEDMPDDTELDDTEGEDVDEPEEEDIKNGKAQKRKASAVLNGKKSKKTKKESEDEEDDEDEDEVSDEEEEDEEMEDEESEDIESSPEVKLKGKGKKAVAAKASKKNASNGDAKKGKTVAAKKKGKAKAK